MARFNNQTTPSTTSGQRKGKVSDNPYIQNTGLGSYKAYPRPGRSNMARTRANYRTMMANTGSAFKSLGGVKPLISGTAFPKYKKGGTVKKTGPAIVHKGEKVIPANKRKMVDKMLKKQGGIGKNYR